MSASEANAIDLKLEESGSISDLLARSPELDDWVSLFASAFGQVAASVGPGLSYCASIVRSARRITYTTKPCGVSGYRVDLVIHAVPSSYINRDKATSHRRWYPTHAFLAVQWEFWKML